MKQFNLNYVVADTLRWEQSAAYYIDRHRLTDAFVKNAALYFTIPYLHNGQMHDYVPDFLIRLKTDPVVHVILETKGYDPLEAVKSAAAHRWVNAVNSEGTYGRWRYEIVHKVGDIDVLLNSIH
jgi:type III restriction enzyme